MVDLWDGGYDHIVSSMDNDVQPDMGIVSDLARQATDSQVAVGVYGSNGANGAVASRAMSRLNAYCKRFNLDPQDYFDWDAVDAQVAAASQQ